MRICFREYCKHSGTIPVSCLRNTSNLSKYTSVRMCVGFVGDCKSARTHTHPQGPGDTSWRQRTTVGRAPVVEVQALAICRPLQKSRDVLASHFFSKFLRPQMLADKGLEPCLQCAAGDVFLVVSAVSRCRSKQDVFCWTLGCCSAYGTGTTGVVPTLAGEQVLAGLSPAFS